MNYEIKKETRQIKKEEENSITKSRKKFFLKK